MEKKHITKEIIIKVEGGCVVDVFNVPKGYKYIINDADIKTGDQND